MIYRGLAITGTDTGVGKTTVAAALAALFREQGLKVGALKPVETGCAGPDLIPGDGIRLARAAGIALGEAELPGSWTSASLAQVVPWRFAAPLAPEEAARQAGTEISVDRIYQAMDRWMEQADLVLVETAGGLMVPINARFTFADLLNGLTLPVLIVAANRLGVINHVLLTLEALRRRDLQPIAVALNMLSPLPDLSAATNAEVIRRRLDLPVYEVPYFTQDEEGETVKALRPRREAIRAAMEAEWRRVAARYVKK